MSTPPPLGAPVAWTPAAPPPATPLEGRLVLLRALDPAADAAPLYAATHAPDGDPAIWTYLPDGPYAGVAEYEAALRVQHASTDPRYFAIVRRTDGRPVGQASYLRITPAHGTIEIGHIWFAPELQRTAAATEAIHLLAARAFDLGYRRLEWKCDALNAPSRRAAERFGFAFEGVFRQHMVVKGRNRDTAWYGMTDLDWPAVRAAFEAWLAPENFDAAGRQRMALRELTPASRP
jgi:RimJ/RimL family protein N-acetyltransferase